MLAYVAVRSKTVVLLLLIFYAPPIGYRDFVFDLYFVMYYFVSFLVCNHLDEEERACYFALIVFLMYCDGKCAVALPCGAVCYSAVCDCGISLSNLLTFVNVHKTSFNVEQMKKKSEMNEANREQLHVHVA